MANAALQQDILDLFAQNISWIEFKNKYMKEYVAWQNRMNLTIRENSASYMNYGGRGIRMHKDWIPESFAHDHSRKAFLSFLQDVGPAPTKEHTIDRIDNDGHYEPSNVRWATRSEQAVNRRNTVKVDGVPLSDLCKQLGKNYHNVYRRIQRGMNPQLALAAK